MAREDAPRDMSDWKPELLQARINEYAPYRGASIQVTRISQDGSELDVEMPLVPDNENLVGTHFGGSLYAMVDPHLMILLMHRLGPHYTVWDRSATIDFVKPGRGLVRATVRITDEEVDAIRDATSGGAPAFPEWQIAIVDGEGDVVATVGKVLYVRRQPTP